MLIGVFSILKKTVNVRQVFAGMGKMLIFAAENERRLSFIPAFLDRNRQ